MRPVLIAVTIGICAGSVFAAADPGEAEIDIAEIVREFVQDFRSDPHAKNPILFGIRINGSNGNTWYVDATGESTGDGSWSVDLHRGMPPEPAFLFEMDADTLRAISFGELNALTARAKATGSDPAPVEVDFMPGFEPAGADFGSSVVNPLTFHFFTTGFPEIVPFGSGLTREVHGAGNVVFYYETGLRTAWTRLEPGHSAGSAESPGRRPFPMLVIGLRGNVNGMVDGAGFALEAGNMMLVPAGAASWFANESDEPAEAILVMFGEGA